MPEQTRAAVKSLRKTILIALALFMLGLSLVVWQSWSARQENCKNTYEGFVFFTHQLGKEFQSDKATIDKFIAGLEPIRDDCS